MTSTVEKVIDDLRAVGASDATPEAARGWLTGLAEQLATWYAGVDEPRAQALPAAFTKGAELPTGIGALADLYAEVREQRLAMEKEAEGVKARETEIHNVILSALSESSDTGASGKKYRVQLVNKTRQHVKDWPSLFGFIRQYDLFDLLQKRLSDKAAAEFVETYKQPLPGVENVDVPTLSFNKI